MKCGRCFDMMDEFDLVMTLLHFVVVLVMVGSIWACMNITKRKTKREEGPLRNENVANVRKVIRPTTTNEIGGGPGPDPDRRRQWGPLIEGAVLNRLKPQIFSLLNKLRIFLY